MTGDGGKFLRGGGTVMRTSSFPLTGAGREREDVVREAGHGRERVAFQADFRACLKAGVPENSLNLNLPAGATRRGHPWPPKWNRAGI